MSAGMDILGFPAVAITDSTSDGRTLLTGNLGAQKAALSVDDLITLSGVSDGATDLGTFAGTTIADNQTIKAALQALETAVESKQAADDDLTTLATAFNSASASAAASLDFHEQTTNGTNRVRLIGPVSTADVTLTLQAVTGTVYSSGGVDVAVADGGTGLSSVATGDILYASASNTLSALAGAVSVIPQFLASAGNGSSNTTTDWRLVPGQILGVSNVATEQSTTSASAVDLSTTQHITFTMPATGNVLISATCRAINTAAGNILAIFADVDGTDATLATAYSPVANYYFSMAGQIVTSLSAGSHTIKLQFSTSGGTANFAQRTITVQAAP